MERLQNMADHPKTVPPPIRMVVVDKDGRPTREMADFMHLLWAQVQNLQKQVQVLQDLLGP
jgi:hypothetical protein